MNPYIVESPENIKFELEKLKPASLKKVDKSGLEPLGSDCIFMH